MPSLNDLVARVRLDLSLSPLVPSDVDLLTWITSGLDELSAHFPRNTMLTLTVGASGCHGHNILTSEAKITAVQRVSDGIFLQPLDFTDPRFRSLIGYYDVRYSRSSSSSLFYLSGCDTGFPSEPYTLYAEVPYVYNVADLGKDTEFSLNLVPILSHFVQWQIYKAMLGKELMEPPNRTRTESDTRDKTVVLDQDVASSMAVTTNTTSIVTPNTTKTVTGTNPAVTTETGTTTTTETGTTTTAGTEATDSTETTGDTVSNVVIQPAEADKIRWLQGIITDARVAYYEMIQVAKGTRQWASSGFTSIANTPARIY